MQLEEMRKLSEPIVKKVVDLLAEKQYQKISEFVEMAHVSVSMLHEMVNEFLEINGLCCIDPFDTVHHFEPIGRSQRFCCYSYRDGSGFAVNYDLTSEGEINDLTLQMEFLFADTGNLKARLLDVHVL